MLAHAGVRGGGVGAAAVTGAAHIEPLPLGGLDPPDIEPEPPLQHRAGKRQAVQAGGRGGIAGGLIVREGLGALPFY